MYPPLRKAKGTRSEANAGDVRGGVIPVPPPVPSIPQATVNPASHRHSRKPYVVSASHRHSSARGNPEKNKSRRLPSPSQSEGDAERSERRGCTGRRHPLSPTCTVIPAKADASADGMSIQSGREAAVSPLPRWDRARGEGDRGGRIAPVHGGNVRRTKGAIPPAISYQ